MKKDLSGKRFGKLVAIRDIERSRNGHIRWECNCDCGGKKGVLSTHLLSGAIKHCGCVKRPTGPKHKQWTGFGDISGGFWNQIQRGANGEKGRRKIDFDITIEYAWGLFEQQKGKCAISGLDINLNRTFGKFTGTASLDRVDSGKGYVVGNVQWVHKDINRMKNSYDQDYFIEMCKLVSANSHCVGGSCEV